MHLHTLNTNKRCKCCGKRLLTGERVWFAKHEGARCLQCGDPGAGAPSPTPAPERQPATPAPAEQPPRKRLKGTGWMSPPERAADGVWRLRWDSLNDMVADAFIDNAANDMNREDVNRRVENNSGSKWANHLTPTTAVALLSEPSRPLLRAVDLMRERLTDDVAMPPVPRRKMRHGRENGDALDPDKWLIREPMAWDRSEREKLPRANVSIAINLSVHAGQKPDDLLYRGAAACALADTLVERGVNVRVVGFLSVSNMSSACVEMLSRVELKAADMPLDLGAVATAASEIGFFRMVMVYATARHATGKLDGALGAPACLPTADAERFDFVIEHDVRSREAADEWLQAAMTKFNGTPE